MFSKRLQPANRVSVCGALLAIYPTIYRLNAFWKVENFVIDSHKPTIYASHSEAHRCSHTEQTHKPGRFTTDIRHVSGLLNVIGDPPSRISAATFSPLTVPRTTCGQSSGV
ncbi:hypothetical protein CRM22_001525 [Opisthorchis felineus]|uniref:Uncharacterized protein n=1 Tax=Opisthorchis felineus TaxID=147828 RepID=A0A4S2MAF7_OPIFE|nr:hypothetical protein CRM22_001525 [Opisthorchis felineus]